MYYIGRYNNIWGDPCSTLESAYASVRNACRDHGSSYYSNHNINVGDCLFYEVGDSFKVHYETYKVEVEKQRLVKVEDETR